MSRIKIKDFIGKKYPNIIYYVLILLLGFFISRNYPDILNQAVVLTKEYSSLIVAIATVLLVMATVLLVMATVLLVKVTLTQNKPWLHFYIKGSGEPTKEVNKNGKGVPRLPPHLYVKNIGKGPAIEIEFEINQIKIPLNALSPQEEVNINVITPDNLDKITIINIKYNDLNEQSLRQNSVTLKPN